MEVKALAIGEAFELGSGAGVVVGFHRGMILADMGDGRPQPLSPSTEVHLIALTPKPVKRTKPARRAEAEIEAYPVARNLEAWLYQLSPTLFTVFRSRRAAASLEETA